MPYAELLEFNQPNTIRRQGYTRIRDAFPQLQQVIQMNAEQSPVVDAYFDPELIVEFAGRWDYGERNAQKTADKAVIERWMSAGEESMIEMAHATFFVECSRVVSHEFVRHRLFSFQQESQRFTKYDGMTAADLFFNPASEEDILEGPVIESSYRSALDLYKALRTEGFPPQLARYVLPNGTKTRMIVSGNMREWRHFLKLRTHKSVQPEMRELALMIYDQLNEVFPTLTKGIIDGERGVR